MFLAKPFVDGPGQSRSMWNLARLAEVMCDRNVGFFTYDDFTHGLPTGKYNETQSNSTGSIALGDLDGGVAIIDSDATLADDSVNVQLGGTAGEIVLPEDGTEIWFEARIAFHDFASGMQFFHGLSITDTAVISAGALDLTDGLGFHSIEDGNDLNFASVDSGGSTTTVSDIDTALVDSDTTKTWYNLGVHIIGTDTVEIFKDGVKDPTEITTNIPTTELRPTWFAGMADGGTDFLFHMDWWYLLKSFRIG